MVTIVLSVATAAEGFTSIPALLPAVAFHAVCAVLGLHLVSKAKTMKQAHAEVVEG